MGRREGLLCRSPSVPQVRPDVLGAAERVGPCFRASPPARWTASGPGAPSTSDRRAGVRAWRPGLAPAARAMVSVSATAFSRVIERVVRRSCGCFSGQEVRAGNVGVFEPDESRAPGGVRAGTGHGRVYQVLPLASSAKSLLCAGRLLSRAGSTRLGVALISSVLRAHVTLCRGGCAFPVRPVASPRPLAHRRTSADRLRSCDPLSVSLTLTSARWPRTRRCARALRCRSRGASS